MPKSAHHTGVFPWGFLFLPMNKVLDSLSGLPTAPRASNLPSQVQSILLEGILVGTLRPGERLWVDEVAEHFGVSKIPVREALKALEVDGWVTSQPRKGTYVRELSLDELRETFEMRRLLEPYSAGQAALRRTDAQLMELERLLDESNEALKAIDVVAVTQANRRIHSVMADAAGNSLLRESIAKLEQLVQRYFVAVDWQHRRESMEQHRAIYEAIRDRNVDLAARLTVAHIDHTESLAEASLLRLPFAAKWDWGDRIKGSISAEIP